MSVKEVTQPSAEINIDWRLQTVAGVGAKTLQSLQEAGIYNVWQLLCHIPKRYEDYTTLTPASLWPECLDKQPVLIQGRITRVWAYFSKGKRLTYCQIESDTITCRIGFFNMHPQVKKKLEAKDQILRCYGQLVKAGNVLSMYHPKYWVLGLDQQDQFEQQLTPVYKNIAGITSSRLQKTIQAALERIEHLPFILNALQQPHLAKQLKLLHQPQKKDFIAKEGQLSIWQQALNALAYEEALAWCSFLKKQAVQNGAAVEALSTSSNLLPTFLQSLPFQLTSDQQQSLLDIEKDLQTSVAMRRLLQGDVGCGKTVVAASVMLMAVETGFQAALLAPTVVLAKQLHATIVQWLEPFNIKVACLVSETSANTQLQNDIKNGVVNVVVGTHALLAESIQFKALNVVVIDEQHRFGVQQREALFQKGLHGNAHALLMSATPIPRSLAQSFFQVTQCSSIKTMPNGRQPIQTVLLGEEKRHALIERIIKQAQAGKQIYWVCPRIDINDQDHKSVLSIYELIKQQAGNLNIGLLHGRMRAEEKTNQLQAFLNKEIDILVTTVVIEVGVNVPNASIIIIDYANQYGLAQLHQLRGRVGRSNIQGYCVLLYEQGLTEEGVERLQIVRDTQDGFALAEKDLQLRGPGQLLGMLQAGCPAWHFLKWPDHKSLIQSVQQQLTEKALAGHQVYLAQQLWGQNSA